MEATQIISSVTLSRRVRWGILIPAFAVYVAMWAGLIMYYWWDIATISMPLWTGMILFSIVTVTVIHEGLHGLFFWIFGGRVKFGAKLKTSFGPVFWATSDKIFSKRQFRMISLAPQILTFACFLVIFLAKLPPIYEIGLWIIAVGNLTGGGFDIYISLILGRFPAGSMFQDKQDGLTVYMQ